VSFIDFAPTFLELAGVKPEKTTMQPIEGESFMYVFKATKDGVINAKRDHVLLGRERTDVGRPHDWGYPVRAIVKNDFLYIKNYEPDRWPTGNPETGFRDTDDSPTKSVILQMEAEKKNKRLWDLCFGKRPGEELYQIDKDPFCMENVADDAAFSETRKELMTQMEDELKEQKDPRMFGNGHIFDEYEYSNSDRNYYDRFIEKKTDDKN
jgi:arylsulfatase A-like enzyme